MRRMKYQSHGRDGAQSSSSTTASTSPEQANLEAENQRLRERLQHSRDTTANPPPSRTPRENLTSGNTAPIETAPNQFPPNWIV